MSAYVFKFIAGKYEGGEFALPEGGEVLIGRSIEVPICLVEDMVSRRHARLLIADNELTIHDLGSTNGTFVNGERIDSSKLVSGDRVLVGTSIMRLEPAQSIVDAERKPLPSAIEIADEMTRPGVAPEPSVAPSAQPKPPVDPAGPPASSEQKLSGQLAEMKLGEVFDLVVKSRRTGVLSTTQAWGSCTFGLEEGTLSRLEASEPYAKLAAQKLFCRLLLPEHVADGTFEFTSGPPPDKDQGLAQRSIEAFLLEAARINDEVQHKLEGLGVARSAAVHMTPQKGRKLSMLPPAQLDVLQLALEQQNIAGTLDAHDSPDNEVLAHLAALLGEGYLAL